MSKEYKVEVLENTLRRITKANADQWKNIENTLRSTFSATFDFHQIYAVDTGAGGDCLFSCVWEAFKNVAPAEIQEYTTPQGVEYLRRLVTGYALERYSFEAKEYKEKKTTADNLFARTVESDVRSILNEFVAILSQNAEMRQDLYNFSKTIKVDSVSQSNLLTTSKKLAESAATLAATIGYQLSLIDVLVPFIRGRMGGLGNVFQDRLEIIGKFPSNDIEDNVTAEEYNSYYCKALAQNQFPSTKRLPSLFAEQWTLTALCNVLQLNIVVLRFDNFLLDVHRFLPQDIDRPFEKVPTMYLLNDDKKAHYYLIFMTFSKLLPELPLHTRPGQDQYNLFCKPLGDITEAAESKKFSVENESLFNLASALSKEAQSEDVTPSLMDINVSHVVAENLDQLSSVERAAFDKVLSKLQGSLNMEFLDDSITEILDINLQLNKQIKAKKFDINKIGPKDSTPFIWGTLRPIFQKLSIPEMRNAIELVRLYLLSVRYPEDFDEKEIQKYFGNALKGKTATMKQSDKNKKESKNKEPELEDLSEEEDLLEELSENVEDEKEQEKQEEQEEEVEAEGNAEPSPTPKPRKVGIDFKTAKICVSGGPGKAHFIVNGSNLSQPKLVALLVSKGVDATKECRADRNIVLVPDGVFGPSKSKTRAGRETWHWSDFERELKRQKKL